MEAEDAKESIEELSSIFSVANFPLYAGKGENLDMDEEEVELDIGMYIPQIYVFLLDTSILKCPQDHSRYKKIYVLLLCSNIPVQLNLGFNFYTLFFIEWIV